MKHDGRAIYLKLCEAPDLSAAVNDLEIKDLTLVAEHLGKRKLRGISAQVWGVVEQALTERGNAK